MSNIIFNDIHFELKPPSNFLSKEVRCEYEISAEMKEVWAVQLDILNQILGICQRHGLRVWLAGGSLLGAVRHKGYVPWDDDLDIMMPYEDWCRFGGFAKNELPPTMFLQNQMSDPSWPHSMLIKVRKNGTSAIFPDECAYGRLKYHMGIFVDILPLVSYGSSVSTSIVRRKLLTMCNLMWKKKFGISVGCVGGGRNLLASLVSYCCPPLFIDAVRELTWSYYPKSKKTNLLLCPLLFPDGERWNYDKRWFEETVFVDFEYLKVPIPKDYNLILDKTYGDWHKLVRGYCYHLGVTFDARHDWRELLENACKDAKGANTFRD